MYSECRTKFVGMLCCSHTVWVGIGYLLMHLVRKSVVMCFKLSGELLLAQICPDCHESKPSVDFQWGKRCPNRQNLCCQPCQRAQKRKQRQAAAPERHVLVDSKVVTMHSLCFCTEQHTDWHSFPSPALGVNAVENCLANSHGQADAKNANSGAECPSYKYCCSLQICRRCQLDKPANEFPRKKEARDGIDCYCKLCHQKATADRVAKRGYVEHPAVSHKVNLIGHSLSDAFEASKSKVVLHMRSCELNAGSASSIMTHTRGCAYDGFMPGHSKCLATCDLSS